MRKTVAVYVCLALVISLALVGCSGAPKPVDLAVKAADFSFEPTSFEVTAGQTVNFTLENQGTQEHEWVLFKAGEKVSMPFDADDEDKIFWEIEAQPGETKTESFVAPDKPGTYDVTCGIAGHAEAGMKGTLVVK